MSGDRWQTASATSSSYTEASVAEVGARPTDEKRIRVSAERILLGRASVTRQHSSSR